MQTRYITTSSIWTAFNNATTAVMRKLRYNLNFAWTRTEDPLAAFATVGSAVVGSTDIIKGESSAITKADTFTYFDETENIISLGYDRVLQEPFGGIAMSILDITLNNISNRYTPNFNSTIGTALLPNRPVNSHVGFNIFSQDKVLPVFKGLTQMPKENKLAKTVLITCNDYIRFINEYPLNSTIYQNKRSDEIIEDILNTIGFGTSQYTLDIGLNTIGFAWFEKGQTAGERIKKICEAEEAVFYQDETGVLRFENRRKYGDAPYNADIWDIDTDDILLWEDDDSAPIINRVIVTAKPRTVSSNTNLEIWRNGIEEEIPASSTIEIFAQFDNPVTALQAITATADFKAYTGQGATGTDITSDIDITTTLFTTAVKLEITNNNVSNTAYLPYLRLRGTMALLDSEAGIKYIYQDDVSVSKYNEYQVTIDNDFIDSETFAESLAKSIVDKYSDPKRRIKLLIQGVPQLQLRDWVRVKDIDTGVFRNFRVMRIQGNLSLGSFLQNIWLREITSSEYSAY